jgi:alkylation response protein AidB-like acyl-CoA dehydrogenase
MDDDALIALARQLGETVLGPRAQETDQREGPDPRNFEALAECGILGMSLPRSYGGLEASGAAQRTVTEILASYCGVTTFTQAQHHGPSRMIYGGRSEKLKARLLPDLASGRMMCAVAFAHLRRPGPPILCARPVEGGLRLTGTAPWVTGWGLMNQVVMGATLPDGRFVWMWSPADRSVFPDLFEDIESERDWGKLEASAPIKLCAMNASATVELYLTDWFVPEDHLLSESDRETMRRNDRNGVLGATAMPLGCASASVRLLDQTAERRTLPAIRRAANSFAQELQDVRGEIETWNQRTSEPEFFETAVGIRAWCIELAVRAGHAAVTATSGAANLLSNPAQRLLREAMFYTIQAQTQEVMDATLSRLEHRSS